jgi:hypothetical protein
MSMAAPRHRSSAAPPMAPRGMEVSPSSTAQPMVREYADDDDWLDADGETYELLSLDEGWPGPYGAASRGAP